MTPGSEINSSQLGKKKAKDLAGCSSENLFPARWSCSARSADSSAVSVSFSTRCASLDFSPGRPLGNCSVLRGFGGFTTPGMGLSLEREKVAQFGAK